MSSCQKKTEKISNPLAQSLYNSIRARLSSFHQKAVLLKGQWSRYNWVEVQTATLLEFRNHSRFPTFLLSLPLTSRNYPSIQPYHIPQRSHQWPSAGNKKKKYPQEREIDYRPTLAARTRRFLEKHRQRLISKVIIDRTNRKLPIKLIHVHIVISVKITICFEVEHKAAERDIWLLCAVIFASIRKTRWITNVKHANI